MQVYDYSEHTPVPHNCIRLLKLLPGEGQTDLEANLQIRAIRQDRQSRQGEHDVPLPEPYEALSYHWGHNDKATKFIKILAQSQSYYIRIKPNLDAALRQLRCAQETRFLWVDALCINQADDDEKTVQILLMSLIYSKAEAVAVWLGPQAERSDQAIEFVRRCLNLDDFDSLVQDSVASKDWAALSDLMRRPWFNRRWIIQEISLAKQATLYCGRDSVSWRDFADVISLFASKEHELRALFRASTAHRNHPDYLGDLSELGAVRLVFAADNLFRKSESGEIMEHLFSLEAVMSSMSAFEASDPHDMLYAVLWLANDAHPVARKAPQVSGLRPRSALLSTQNSPSTSPTMADFRDDSPKRFELSDRNPQLRISTPPPLDDALDETSTGVKQADKSSRQLRNAVVGSNVTDGAAQNQTVANGASSIRRSSLPRDDAGPSRTSTFDEDNKNKNQHLVPERMVERRMLMRRLSMSRYDESEDETQRKILVTQMLVDSINSKRIIVDYKKDVFQVCKDFLEFTIRKSKSLDMICRPWAPDNCKLPSWVPPLGKGAFSPSSRRVHRRVNADPLVGEPGTGGKSYRAARSLPADWSPRPDNERALNVKGFVLDSIREKKSAAAAGIVPAEWMIAGGWYEPTTLPPDSFWRTLVGNRNAYGQRPPSHWRRVCRDAFERKPARGDLNTSEIIMYDDCPSTVRGFLERVQCMVWSRRLVLLNHMTSCLALVPNNAKKGDLICILNGCSVPVVLRKFVNGELAAKGRSSRCTHPYCPTNKHLRQQLLGVVIVPNGADTDKMMTQNEYYEFIGEAYVHGMMDGEAFNEKKERNLPVESFELQ